VFTYLLTNIKEWTNVKYYSELRKCRKQDLLEGFDTSTFYIRRRRRRSL